MRYHTLLFDADGTLFDFDAAEHSALSETLALFGCECTDAQLALYHNINAELWKLLELGEVTREELVIRRFAEFSHACGIELDVHAVNACYMKKLGECSIPFPDAKPLLERLHGRFRMAIVTNGLAYVQHSRFDNCELTPFFEAIYISEEVGCQKPQRMYFDVVLDRMGIDEREGILIIGDSLTSDMQGGVNSGIDTCWYNPEHKPNNLGLCITHEISRLDELLDIVI